MWSCHHALPYELCTALCRVWHWVRGQELVRVVPNFWVITSRHFLSSVTSSTWWLACATAASDSQASQQAIYLSILMQYQSVTQPSSCSGVTRCISITCPAQHDFFYPNTSTLSPSKHIISLLIGFCRGELIVLCSHWRPHPWYLWIRVGTDKLKVFYPIDLFCVGPLLSMQRAYEGLVLFTPPMKLQTRPLLMLLWLVMWQFCQLGRWLHEYSMGLLVYIALLWQNTIPLQTMF